MTATFYVGDAIETMNNLPEKSVDLILTSPPFLALRSYLPADHPDKALEGGSQATPGAFIDWLADVVEACARVLAPHGSLCIELGDTYAGSGGAGGDYNPEGLREGQPKFRQNNLSAGTNPEFARNRQTLADIPMNAGHGWPLAKSLSLIPELFRFTLVYGTNPLTGRTTDRWRLRNVVRWVRPNPPVGALGDKFRPATSELMVFCKSAKRYFDLDAVREPAVSIPQRFFKHAYGMRTGGDDFGETVEGRPPLLEPGVRVHPAGAPPLDWWNIPLLEGEEETRQSDKGKPRNRQAEPSMSRGGRWNSFPNVRIEGQGAPPLDWWEIPPGGYQGSHYAVFPPELCIKPIKAMCPEHVCRQCGEPQRRIAETTNAVGSALRWKAHTADIDASGTGRRDIVDINLLAPDRAERVTLGWTDCGHDDYRNGLVLDPFGGSGTTALVATGHGRDCILVDLDERNYELALQRVGPFILERAG